MNRYWTSSGEPLGPWPEADTFDLLEGTIPTPGPGQASTRTIYISLDPYQWGYKKRRAEPPGAPCHARTVAQVVESRMDGARGMAILLRNATPAQPSNHTVPTSPSLPTQPPQS